MRAGTRHATAYTVVIPTVGRPQLWHCLSALGAATGPPPQRVIVVDDRPEGTRPLDDRWRDVAPELSGALEVRRSGGRGPAGARNVGWTAAGTPWVVFLDDDVRVTSTWRADLAADLAGAADGIAGVQGRIEAPMPSRRRPTDWERGTAGLARAWWITADMAYRRVALARVGGFDERFRRAYREDSDIALRMRDAGYGLVTGSRRTAHPVRLAGRWASVKAQAGNADDALMRRLHGADWRVRAGAPPGRRARHLAVTTAGVAAMALAAAGRRGAALAPAAVWAAGTAEFSAARILPGPRTAREIAVMISTSTCIPAAATYHWVRGRIRHRHPAPWTELSPWVAPTRAVLFDRDGTIINDDPYNGDLDWVRPVPGAAETLRALRAAGLAVGVVSNQSGVARGLITAEQVEAVNGRVEQLLGPFDAWAWCAHGRDDGCECRKPAPGLVLRAAADLGISPQECLVVGDTGSDVAAARAAGARCVLVPNRATRRRELRGVRTASDLGEAVHAVLAGTHERPGPMDSTRDSGNPAMPAGSAQDAGSTGQPAGSRRSAGGTA